MKPSSNKAKVQSTQWFSKLKLIPKMNSRKKQNETLRLLKRRSYWTISPNLNKSRKTTDKIKIREIVLDYERRDRSITINVSVKWKKNIEIISTLNRDPIK